MSAAFGGARGLPPEAEAGERWRRADPPPPEAQTGRGGPRQTWARAPGSSGDSWRFRARAGRPGRPRPSGFIPEEPPFLTGEARRAPPAAFRKVGLRGHLRPSPYTRGHCQWPVSLWPGQGAVEVPRGTVPWARAATAASTRGFIWVFSKHLELGAQRMLPKCPLNLTGDRTRTGSRGHRAVCWQRDDLCGTAARLLGLGCAGH